MIFRDAPIGFRRASLMFDQTQPNPSRIAMIVLIIGVTAVCTGTLSPSFGEEIYQLKNGLDIRGTKQEIPSLKQGIAPDPDGAGSAIWMIDDGLRRQIVHGVSMVVGDPVPIGDVGTVLDIWQPESNVGDRIGGLGTVLGTSPFNNFGRRFISVRGPTGAPMELLQGIRTINPRFASLIAIGNRPAVQWDMRVSTASIDSDTLTRILGRRVRRDDLDARLDLVRFFKDTQRYARAHDELRRVIADFPDEKTLPAQLTAMAQAQASQLIAEAGVRIDAGQRRLGREILARFPVNQISRVGRIEIEEAIAKLDAGDAQVDEILERLQSQSTQLRPDVRDSVIGPLATIRQGLSADTIERLSDYVRLGASDDLPIDDRVALAISGWMVGGGRGTTNLAIATSMHRVGNLVNQYLAAEDQPRRAALIAAIKAEEAGQVNIIDQMLPRLLPALRLRDAAIKPVVDAADPAGGEPPTETFDDADPSGHRVVGPSIDYRIVLPPEYDPHRDYPCIIALHHLGASPDAEIAWWCGDQLPNPTQLAGGSRVGHASRNGYIVVAPSWARPAQRGYEFTAIERHRVLASMRDAMRRTSIDSDRIYIAGHGEGGTAAWDIAISHPGLWAGLIAVSPRAEKTILHYERNARAISKYFVMGELDGDRVDGAVLDDYLSPRHDAMIVMYRGRGRENFYDEVPQMMRWMNASSTRRRRLPGEIETATIRQHDRFFWWLEIDEVDPNIAVDPVLWDQAERTRAAIIEASIVSDNLVRVAKVPSDAFTVWLRPMPGVDLNQPVRLNRGGRKSSYEFDGDIETILEDVRRRADRKRAFWMRIDYPS